VYLLGHHGNNLYPSSLRLFSNKEFIILYLYEEYIKSIKEHELKIRKDRSWWADKMKTFVGNVDLVSWRLYRMDVDDDNVPKNIKKAELLKWVKESGFEDVWEE